MNKPVKPLGGKSYGSIPHLPSSRLGPGEHYIHSGQETICTAKTRDKHDRVILTEKLDGSNVSVAKVNGTIWSLGRAGYAASTSPFEQHLIFADWVARNETRFSEFLNDSESLHGEWLAQAHGTLYRLEHEPFVVFDLKVRGKRRSWDEVVDRCASHDFVPAFTLSAGAPVSLDAARQLIETSHHGAIDPVEGAVWRVERRGEFDFMAKWVRPDKVDGKYLPEVSGKPSVWLWQKKEAAGQ